MPSLLSRLVGALAPARETKYSRAAKLLAMHALGHPHWSARNSTVLTREGYERNAVCHRCVRMVAEAAASVPWLVYEGRDEAVDHPLLSLIERPNPLDTSASFIEAICANLLLYGNAYVESVLIDEELRELYALRPDRMSVEPGRSGWPAAFVYRAQGQEARYEMRGEGIEPILHIRFFNPLDDYYGFPPLAAAQVALDTHNAASFWNKALLDNSARPSGALVYAGPEGAHLTDEQFSRLKEELEENFSGATNAGRPLLLEGGLDWKALSLSPKDMDFTESKAGAAREIALAFGVPPLLLGLPGDNTFSNYSEANRAFWRQTVLPLVARVQKSFQAWLRPGFGPFRFDYDADGLEALASERASEWERVGKAAFLTLDEQREAVGYGPAPKEALFDKRDADGLERRYSPSQPRVPAGSSQGGQWTSGGGLSGGASGGARDDRARRRDVEGRVQTALNANPRVASDADGSFTLAQSRGGGRGRGGGFSGPGEATPSQLDRLEDTARLAREAETRTREIDPVWKPESALIDPNNIEARIARNESVTRQANQRYSEHLRELYGDLALPDQRDSSPRGDLTGPRALVRRQDDSETRRGAERENQSADILWLNGHAVEQKPDVPGPKRPDYRIDGEVFDNYAPVTGSVRSVWNNVERKVARKQASSIIINLRDSSISTAELERQFRRYRIDGLNRLWVIDRDGKLIYLKGGW